MSPRQGGVEGGVPFDENQSSAAAVPEKRDVLTALESQLTKGVIYTSKEAAALMLRAMIHEFKEQGLILDAYYRVEEQGELPVLKSFLSEITQVSMTSEPGEIRLIQLLYLNGIHTSLIAFQVMPNNVNCFILDAVCHPSITKMHAALMAAEVVDNVYVVSGEDYNHNLQKSHNMCLYFALELLLAMQVIDPYPVLETSAIERPLAGLSTEFENLTCHCIGWSDLPGIFVKDAESRAFHESYLLKNPHALDEVLPGFDITLAEYINENIDEVSEPSEVYPNFPSKSRAIQNRALLHYFLTRNYYFKLREQGDAVIRDELSEKPIISNEELKTMQMATRDRDRGKSVYFSNLENLLDLRRDFELKSPYEDCSNIANPVYNTQNTDDNLNTNVNLGETRVDSDHDDSENSYDDNDFLIDEVAESRETQEGTKSNAGDIEKAPSQEDALTVHKKKHLEMIREKENHVEEATPHLIKAR